MNEIHPSAPGTTSLSSRVTKSLDGLSSAGKALDELEATAPAIAKDAKAATQTLSSTAGFVLPYAFAVLAIGAMFVSIGVASILKSLKLRDDSYDEAVELNRTLMLARLASAVRSQGGTADALVERLARLGERQRKGEVGVPLPVARALSELVKALKE